MTAATPHTATTGPDTFRARFPHLSTTAYLASCSLAARSQDVEFALLRMLDDMTAGDAWQRFEAATNTAKARFADLIGASPDQVAVLPNASVGAYQAASSLIWANRPALFTTGSEFPSIAHVWLAQRQRGADVRFVDADGYHELIDERVGLVSVPSAAYYDGARADVAAITAAAHASGALVFVDAYQSVGVEPIDVNHLGCDFLVAGAGKYLLGLPGVAFLYVRAPEARAADPTLTGWFGRVDPFAFDPRRLDFAASAARYQTGTPAVPAGYAAAAGLGMVAELDPADIREHVAGLTAYAVDRLTDAGERLRTPPLPAQRGAHVGMVDPVPTALAAWLAERSVIVSPRRDIVRLAFHYFNNRDDVDEFCALLHEYRQRSGRSESLGRG